MEERKKLGEAILIYLREVGDPIINPRGAGWCRFRRLKEELKVEESFASKTNCIFDLHLASPVFLSMAVLYSYALLRCDIFGNIRGIE